MSVPGREDAAALLISLDPPAWHLRHSRAVAEVAAWLAARAASRDPALDRRLVEAGALLHDVDKLLPPEDPARDLSHGHGSAAWLRRQGHDELAPIVAAHPVTRLLHADPPRDLAAAIVAYADKRAGQQLESMAERFASWDRRYPETWSAAERATVERRAQALERDVCAAAGVRPEDVGRLRWAGVALAAARERATSDRAA